MQKADVDTVARCGLLAELFSTCRYDTPAVDWTLIADIDPDDDGPDGVDVKAAEWREEDHPREPAGSSGGGQFTDKVGSFDGVSLQAPAAGGGVDDEQDEVIRRMLQAASDREENAALADGPELAEMVHSYSFESVSAYRAEVIDGAEVFGIDPDMAHDILVAAEEKLKDELSLRSVVVHVEHSVLDQILADGRLKSQFETSKSGGLYSPHLRAQVEDILFGYDESSTPDPLRPVYGALESVREIEKEPETAASYYGEVVLVMKDDLKERTTFTFNDSLGLVGSSSGEMRPAFYPAPVNRPSAAVLFPAYRSATVAQREAAANIGALKAKLLADASLLENQRVSYTEVQIHGDNLFIKNVVKEVIFKHSPPSKYSEDRLREMGIPFRVLGGD